MSFEPCIPKEWKEYKIKYKWKKSIYNIKIENPGGKNTGVKEVYLDEKLCENEIRLIDENRVHNIRVIM